ncbi:hypothetical protein V6N12_076455 [Hibiscus sabdariffa]|uniref:Uncharacterized protein n=1 Tax=Hibiscus sabdariffa TaxID=183260 RepID=A0ABR2DBL1_9ROSI
MVDCLTAEVGADWRSNEASHFTVIGATWAREMLTSKALRRRLVSAGGLKSPGAGRTVSTESQSVVTGMAIKAAAVLRVNDLMLPNAKFWNHELIESSFSTNEAEAILSIPLPKSNLSDQQVWRGKHSEVYYVRSGYKFLLDPNQLNEQEKKTFKVPWDFICPSKVRIMDNNQVAHIVDLGKILCSDTFWIADAPPNILSLVKEDRRNFAPP